MPYVAAYISSAIAFLILDIAWLSFAASRLYRPVIGEILADKVSLAPAVAFYLIYIAGIVFLAVAPSIKAGSFGRVALTAAVLGLVCYATYDLTNQATLKVWSLRITLADLAWGTFVTTAAALAGLWGARTATRLFGAA
jgi:uncharacterized membrane protein